MKHEKKSFGYLGRTFIPVKRLNGKESEFDIISRHLSSDRELGFATYSWKKQNYSYDEFYKACGEKYYDIFRCEENGKIYIPGQNELFEYMS